MEPLFFNTIFFKTRVSVLTFRNQQNSAQSRENFQYPPPSQLFTTCIESSWLKLGEARNRVSFFFTENFQEVDRGTSLKNEPFIFGPKKNL